MKKLSILTATLLSGALVLTACSKTQSNSSEQNNSSSSSSTEEKKTRQAFDFSAMDKDGNTVKLSDYKGKYQDCTMLVTNALKAVGINFHDWPAGYMSLGTVVPASQAQPGDLIYYANGGMGLAHIAVYAGNGQAVHGGWNGNQTVLNVANLGSGPVYIRVK